jgi:hypothetical protein
MSFRTLTVALLCLFASGCDPTQTSRIDVSFPKSNPQEVTPIVLEIGRELGYKIIGHKKLAPDRVEDDKISFTFGIYRDSNLASSSTWVNIENISGHTVVTFVFGPSIQKLNDNDVREYFLLKNLLIKQFGSAVITHDEP